ncbi:MAG: UPF0147 family protein [Nanoarchaeota archaeon]|nr:UPF0147 family protein [Nanoarchaeota archaeon]MBU4352309.1 UPF0147 family protein [Nanoarchaeota archaeon]MBU4456740.1 UPF0147 family protein [Nanoarchaeota archaeon]
MSDMNELMETLEILQEDNTIPRNVRLKVQNAIALLKEEGDIKMKANKALQELDNLSDDPNVPSYVLPQIWNIVSLLEGF